MLKTHLKVVGLLACWAWFGLANAATMGGINVVSALGHPLRAEISLGDMGKNDKSTIVAKLASVNEFKAAGIEYPYSLPKLTFEVASRSNGESYLKLTSTQPINEPFVSLLVELSWPAGKLLREYTFLLDPAGFVAEQPKAAEVKPVEPVLPVEEPVAVIAAPIPVIAAEPLPEESAAVVAAEPEPVIAKAEPVPAEQAAPADTVAPATEMAQAEVVAAPASDKTAGEETQAGTVVPAEELNMQQLPAEKPAEAVAASILVEKGDTLGRIAGELKPVDVSLERMLVALYRANAKQFDGKNMNRIRAGKILRMPENEEIEKISQKAAVREIRAQVADWQEYRQKLAAARAGTPIEEPKQEAAGKISAAVAEQAPVVKESAKEVLRLSKGEALGDKAVPAGGSKGKQEAELKADDAAAKKKQEQEDKQKIAKLETISKEASKLVELKAAPPAAEKPAPAPVAEEKKPAPIPAPTPAPEPEAEMDIVGMIVDFFSSLDLMLVGAVVAVVAGLGGLGFVLNKRRKGGPKAPKKKNEAVGEGTGSWKMPVQPSPDTGDFTRTAAPVAAAAPMSVAAAIDDVDPISEADLFLNFGRDVQAEEILKDALEKNPANVQIKLKLLSIYSGRKDIKSFSKYAQEVKDSGDTSAWERAAVMGREIDPSNPEYGGVKGEPRQQREPTKAEVDFDLGLGTAASPAISAVAASDFKMDFDLTGNQPSAQPSSVDLDVDYAKTMVSSKPMTAEVDATSILSREIVKAAESASPMDFDVSGILPGDVKNMAQSSTMDFDISGAIPSGQSAEPATSMDFDLSLNEAVTSAPQESAIDVTTAIPSMNFDDLKFDLPGSEPEPAAPAPAAAKPAMDDGMAFTIDFPTSMEEPAAAKPAASSLDIDFGNININLDDDMQASSSAADGKDEHWHEVATKLDLAKAYQEMGDADGAREILEEVVKDGDNEQKESAEKLLQQLAA